VGLSLGVDVGGSTTKWVLLGADRAVVARGRAPTSRLGPKAVAEAVASLSRPDVERIGTALPGHVDHASGRVLFIPNLAGEWSGFPFAEAVTERTGVPATAVVNDAIAFALAELRLGSRTPDAVFVTLGTGVGGAVANSGHVLTGRRHNLGQIGHLTVDPNGPACPCGNLGCAEAFAGAPALVAAFASAGGRKDATAREVAEAARAGDPVAGAVFGVAGHALGIALGDALAVFAVDTVVIGGGLAAALPLLRPGIEAELARRRDLLGPCTVTPARLGPYAGAIGAALWAWEGHP
jgi:predicted NBD/HSP70 family sugar kinase